MVARPPGEGLAAPPLARQTGEGGPMSAYLGNSSRMAACRDSGLCQERVLEAGQHRSPAAMPSSPTEISGGLGRTAGSWIPGLLSFLTHT